MATRKDLMRLSKKDLLKKCKQKKISVRSTATKLGIVELLLQQNTKSTAKSSKNSNSNRRQKQPFTDGIIPHYATVNKTIDGPWLYEALPGNYLTSYNEVYKYNKKYKKFLKGSEIDYAGHGKYNDHRIFGCDKKAKEIYLFHDSFKPFVYTIRTSIWKKMHDIPIPNYDTMNYRLFLFNGLLHFFCHEYHDKHTYIHYIWNIKEQVLKSKRYPDIEEGAELDIFQISRGDTRFYIGKSWNVMVCINIPYGEYRDKIIVYYCKLSDIDTTNPNEYKWNSVSIRIPKDVDYKTNTYQLEFEICAVYDCVIILFYFKTRSIYYRNWLFMDKWVKLKYKLPNNGLYAVRKDAIPITTVKVTNDNMVHLIQKTAMSDKQYCIGIELNDILPITARMNNETILMLIRGFVMQRNQWHDIISIIVKYFCGFA